MSKNDGDPSGNQSPAEITEYYKNAKVRDAACIKTTYAGILEFKMSVIEKSAVKSRIAIKAPAPFGGCGFYVDGRNNKSPGGQAKLVKPTAEIEEWLRAHPHGSSNWR